MNIRLKRFLITVIAAPAAALALWTLAVPVGGVDLVAASGGEAMTVGPVATAVAAAVAGLLGWAFLAVLERFTERSGRIWVVTALVVLVVSIPLGPLGGEGAAAVAVLALLHVVVGAVVIPGLRRKAAA
ncbi:MAG TPA: DUF6069 family protein [Glycomyces sp.]|nr:DUF6069 family protein [Glycomyces sp.]